MEPTGSGHNKITWFTVWTAVASEGIKMQHKSNSASIPTHSDQISMVAIEISEELTEGTDWDFDFNSTNNSLTSSFANYSTLTIEAGDHNSGDTWLVLGYANLEVNSLTENYESRLQRSGEADSTEPTISREGEDPSEQSLQFFARTFDLGSSDNTFTIGVRSDGAGSGSHGFSGLFALNLEKFVDSNEIYTETDEDFQTTDWADLIQTLSLTPTATGDIFILSNHVADFGDTTQNNQARLQVDNTDEPTGQTALTFQTRNWGVKDQIGHSHFTIENLDNTAHTFDVDGDSNNISATPHAQSRQLVAFSMELVGGGAGNTESFTDELGIEDLFDEIHNVSESDTDELGIEDSLDVESGTLIIFTDELAIEDAINIVANNIYFIDELGIEDSMNVGGASTISFTDELGIEDSLDVDSVFAIGFTDELGIDDSLGIASGTAISFTDKLAIDDSLATTVSVISFTDELGIEDTQSQVIPTPTVFNAILLYLNSPESDRLGGVFAITCPTNSTLTGLLTNGTFICTPIGDILP